MSRSKGNAQLVAKRGANYLLLVVVALLFVGPILWMVSGSLKSLNEILVFPPDDNSYGCPVGELPKNLRTAALCPPVRKLLAGDGGGLCPHPRAVRSCRFRPCQGAPGRSVPALHLSSFGHILAARGYDHPAVQVRFCAGLVEHSVAPDRLYLRIDDDTDSDVHHATGVPHGARCV